MISGLNSTGVDVADLRVSPPPVARHVLKTQAYDAGVHVGAGHADPEVVQSGSSSRPGIQLASALQKEIEKHFSRQELRRVGVRRGRGHRLPGARARELRARPARLARRGGDPRARVPHRRRLRLLRRLVRAAARARPARRRGGLGARVHRGGRGSAGSLARGARPDEAARHAPSAPTSASSSTARPSGSTSSTRRARRCPSSRRCSSSCSCSARRAGPGKRRLPGHRDEPGRPLVDGSGSRSCARRPRSPT